MVSFDSVVDEAPMNDGYLNWSISYQISALTL